MCATKVKVELRSRDCDHMVAIKTAFSELNVTFLFWLSLIDVSSNEGQ